MARWWLASVVLFVAFLLVACPSSPPASSEARIESFASSAVSVSPGASVTLSWRAVNTDTCWLQSTASGASPDAAESVSCTGSRVASPAASTTYRFSALKRDGVSYVWADVVIEVGSAGGSAPPPFTGDAPVAGETGDAGEIVVVSESLGVQYDLTFRGEQGEPAAGVELVYRENARGRSEFWLSDPSGLYAPLLLVGTPEELADQLGLTQAAVSSAEIGTSFDPFTLFAGAVFLQALGVKFDKNGVAHQEVRYFVESGDDLCAEPDVYCTCATMAEVVELQSAAAYIDGLGGELVFSVVMFMGGLANSVGEVIGLALDLMSAWGVGEGSAGAVESLVEEARATAGLESLDPDEPLLVRLLGFEAADAERNHSWRGVQVLNRGCGSAGLPDSGTLDVALVPSPPSPGREVQIDVQVGSLAEADLDVVLSVRNVRSGLEFSRVLTARTNSSGRASFVLPPFYASIDAEYVVAVPERDLVFWESFEWDYLDTSVGRPRPTIWYLEPTRSRFDAPGGVNFWFQVSQVHEEPAFEEDLTCRLDFGDGSLPRDFSCVGTLGSSVRIRTEQHRYVTPGTYLARLTATNRDGSRDEVSVPIQVLGDSNRAPDVTLFTASSTNVAIDGSVRFDWSVADHDRDDKVSCVFDAGDGSRRRVFDPCGSHEVWHQYRRQSPEWGYYATLSAVDRRGAYAPSRSATVVVGHEVVVGKLTLTPGTIIGSAVEGGSAVGSFELENFGEVAVVVQSIASDAPWVSVSPSSVASIGVGERVDVSVTLSAAGLAPGDYVTDVVVSWAPVGGGPTSTGQVGVELTVSPGAGDPVVVSIAPTSVTLPANGTQSFSATVTGTANTGVTWSATCGTLTGTGNTRTYTAPGVDGTCRVRATSVVDGGAWDEATVTVVEDDPREMAFVGVSGGATFTLALDDLGRVWGWGAGSSGQRGDGSVSESAFPTMASAPPGVAFSQVSAGSAHSLALDVDGRAWAWGNNSSGQLGDGTTTMRLEPVLVRMPMGVLFTSIAAGGDSSLALDQDGEAWAWGANGYGQLGAGIITGFVNEPVRVQMPSGVDFIALSAGLWHSLAIDQFGRGWGWGDNYLGKLGNGMLSGAYREPVAISMEAGVGIVAVSAGDEHSLAVDTNGRVWSWGSGSLGTGDSYAATPRQLNLPEDVVIHFICAGGSHSLALANDGQAYAWGRNTDGELGDSTTESRLLPVSVTQPSGVFFAVISAGWSHSLALDELGLAWAWGRNVAGELGYVTVLPYSTAPQRVSEP